MKRKFSKCTDATWLHVEMVWPKLVQTRSKLSPIEWHEGWTIELRLIIDRRREGIEIGTKGMEKGRNGRRRGQLIVRETIIGWSMRYGMAVIPWRDTLLLQYTAYHPPKHPYLVKNQLTISSICFSSSLMYSSEHFIPTCNMSFLLFIFFKVSSDSSLEYNIRVFSRFRRTMIILTYWNSACRVLPMNSSILQLFDY